MLSPRPSGAFKRDMKSCKKKHWDMDALKEVMNLICEDTAQSRAKLIREYRDHPLTDNWGGTRECHVADLGDWIVIYVVSRKEGVVDFVATGTHDQFFKSKGHEGRWKKG